MDDPAIMPPKPDNGKAWFFWWLATMVLPAIVGGTWFTGGLGGGVAVLSGLIAFPMHFMASMKLESLNGCAVFFLYIGGWVLMLASFFVGCVAFFPKL